MKQRLVFYACSFIALGLLAHAIGKNSDDSAVSERSALESPQPLTSTSTSTTSSTTTSTQPSTSTSTSNVISKRFPTSAPSAPTTESSALGFLQTYSSRSWDFKRDDFGNHIRTLSGGQLESKTILARDAGDEFVKFYAKGLFGVDPAQVKFNREEVTDRTRLIYDQSVDGVTVYGGSLSLFFENGSLTRVQNDLAPFAVEPGSIPAPVSQAFSSYRSVQDTQFDVRLQDHASNRAVLYPNGRSLVYAYEFVTNETEKGSASARSFHVLYDAADKFVIQRRPSAVH